MGADVIYRVIMASPTKSCPLDPIPTFLLKEVIDILLPYVTAMINASLSLVSQARLPVSEKQAIVSPMLKKPGLNQSDMSNYRPVSNLTFLSKTVERIVAEQFVEYLS